MVLKGICSVFQKDYGQTSALTSAICGCHKHQALFPCVRLSRMIVGMWCSAGKEPLSAVPPVTFLPGGLYSTSGCTGCWFLGLFSLLLSFFCQSSQLWDLLMDIHPLCSTALHPPAETADAATSEWDLLQEEILHFKNPLLTTFKIWSVNQKHIAKNTPSASRANSNKE